MPDGITADVRSAVKGLDELERRLQRKGIRTSLRTAAKPTLSLSRSTAPVFTGLLQQNIKLRSAGVRKGTYKMNVGIGKKWFTGPTFYGAFEAFGHRIGKRQLGDVRRQLPPNTWLEKAYEATKATAVELFRATIMGFIERGGE
jgi:hypothetical protein